MPKPTIARITRLALVCADIGVTEHFFIEAFDAKAVSRQTLGEAHAALFGVPGAQIEESVVRIGEQEIALLQFDPPGKTYPGGSTSTDLWFQHFAIIVSNMGAAYDRLRATGRFTPISEGGPQRLPPSSGSVEAFKFRDAEGHPLEFLCFPDGKGPELWQAKRSSGLFLGIDHSAISVGDTATSRAFYEGALGLAFGEQTENTGAEQSRMDAVSYAAVTVTGLKPDHPPPNVELLGYKVGSCRTIDEATTSSDIAATQYVMESVELDGLVERLTAKSVRFVSPGIVALPDGARAIMVCDPDGHRLIIRGP